MELTITHETHGEATVAASDWNGDDERLNSVGWGSRGWAVKGEKPAAAVVPDAKPVKPVKPARGK